MQICSLYKQRNGIVFDIYVFSIQIFNEFVSGPDSNSYAFSMQPATNKQKENSIIVTMPKKRMLQETFRVHMSVEMFITSRVIVEIILLNTLPQNKLLFLPKTASSELLKYYSNSLSIYGASNMGSLPESCAEGILYE